MSGLLTQKARHLMSFCLLFVFVFLLYCLYFALTLPRCQGTGRSTAWADAWRPGWGTGEGVPCCWSWGSSCTAGRWRWPNRRRRGRQSRISDSATPKMGRTAEAAETAIIFISLMLNPVSSASTFIYWYVKWEFFRVHYAIRVWKDVSKLAAIEFKLPKDICVSDGYILL